MPFDTSLVKVLDQQPWRWTTPPNPDGTGGVKQTLNGVFILFSDELVAILKAGLTQVQKDELQTWVNQYTEAQCADWHVPVWAGNDKAVYCRVPAAIWNDPTTAPPQKVKDYFQSLWRAAT
jgi:hypothetical protein